MHLETQTVAAMIRMYCRAHHASGRNLCGDCSALLVYVEERIGRCPFGAAKPVCNKCTVHCYAPEQREKIREVMRYSGPRMLWRHPVLAIRHAVRSRRSV